MKFGQTDNDYLNRDLEIAKEDLFILGEYYYFVDISDEGNMKAIAI